MAWRGARSEDEVMRGEGFLSARGGGQQLMSPVGVRSSCRSLPLRGRTGGRATVPCTVSAERAAGGGGPTRRPPRRPPSFPDAIRAASALVEWGGCR